MYRPHSGHRCSPGQFRRYRRVSRRLWRDCGILRPWRRNQERRFLYPKLHLRPHSCLPVLSLPMLCDFFLSLSLSYHLRLYFHPMFPELVFRPVVHPSDRLSAYHQAFRFRPAVLHPASDHYFLPAALRPVSGRPVVLRRPADLFSSPPYTGTWYLPGNYSMMSPPHLSDTHNMCQTDRFPPQTPSMSAHFPKNP